MRKGCIVMRDLSKPRAEFLTFHRTWNLVDQGNQRQFLSVAHICKKSWNFSSQPAKILGVHFCFFWGLFVAVAISKNYKIYNVGPVVADKKSTFAQKVYVKTTSSHDPPAPSLSTGFLKMVASLPLLQPALTFYRFWPRPLQKRKIEAFLSRWGW